MPGLHMHIMYTVPYQIPWDSKALLPELPGLMYPCPKTSSLYTAFYSVLLLVMFFFHQKLQTCDATFNICPSVFGALQNWLLCLPSCSDSLLLRTFGCVKAPHFLSVFLADSRLRTLLLDSSPHFHTLSLSYSAFHPL